MKRIVRVTLDVVGLRDPDPVYEVVVGESIRTASWRPTCHLQVGECIREADLALSLQIVEDVFASAVGRTIGLAQVLTF